MQPGTLARPMNEPAVPPSPTPVHRFDEFSARSGKTLPGPRPSTASHGAWLVAHTLLALAGGHGLFLLVALTRLRSLPTVSEVGGPLNGALVLGLVACGPLTAVTALLRSRYEDLPARRAWTLTAVLSAAVLAAFALYLRKMVLA